MFAIVDIAGQQFKVEKDQTVYVHRLPHAEGASVELNKVLLVNNNGSIKVGVPTVTGANVKAKVLTFLRRSAEKATGRKTVTVSLSLKFR
jgi:large subunit ribosomal protein L21